MHQAVKAEKVGVHKMREEVVVVEGSAEIGLIGAGNEEIVLPEATGAVPAELAEGRDLQYASETIKNLKSKK